MKPGQLRPPSVKLRLLLSSEVVVQSAKQTRHLGCRQAAQVALEVGGRRGLDVRFQLRGQLL